MTSDFSLFNQPGPGDAVPQHGEENGIRREVAVLALGEIPGVGHSTAVKLYDEKNFGSLFTANCDEVHWIAGNAHVASPHTFTETFMAHRERALESAASDLDRYEGSGVDIILDTDPRYPQRLLALSDRPRWLFVKGNVDALNSERLITVVGTRKPTQSGLDLAARVTTMLVKHGFVTVSGLAEGVDGEVHRRTIEHKGQTVAVLGTGIFNEFPATTAHMRGPIVHNGGAIITEYFPKEQYSKQRFVQRNRIQAALSNVTIPVEAAVPSGTFHTIRFALEYGRIVLGVKWKGTEDLPLHLFLRERGQPVVEVSPEDDPFLEALGRSYDYWHFLQDSEQARRKAQIDRAVRFAHSVIKSERLSDFEVDLMVRRIRENQSE
uniref:Smf/DprA SLOG domain-containing protein n=1 Tax=mine drainage metagenome TaxID=410659 RepID=E6QWP6_9ZZZZ